MSLFPGMEGLCPRRAQKGHTPSEGVDSRCCGNATPVETAHRAVSKSRLSNPPPSKQKNSILTDAVNFGGRWWIRTTEVIDDRFTVCSLWPLGKPSIFNYRYAWYQRLNYNSIDYLNCQQISVYFYEKIQPTEFPAGWVVIRFGVFRWLSRPGSHTRSGTHGKLPCRAWRRRASLPGAPAYNRPAP